VPVRIASRTSGSPGLRSTLEQPLVGLGVDGVALIRPIEGDVRDFAALL
jgi:hypothetical protein